MNLLLEKWKEEDALCYITKVMENVKTKLSSLEYNYLAITGAPGSGKSTIVRHVALYLQRAYGYTIYPIAYPNEFFDYLDEEHKQVFIMDDPVGEYCIDDYIKVQWDRYNKKITTCLRSYKNTKFLMSIRVQILSDLSLTGINTCFNDASHIINLSSESLKLSVIGMKGMLRQYLEREQVGNIDGIIRSIWKESDSTIGREIAECFPLLCKIFSEHKSIRDHPMEFFADPLPMLTNIFKHIQENDKYQFCGLVLCFFIQLNDHFLDLLCERNIESKDKIYLRNAIMESLGVESKELKCIALALKALDGVYITHVGNTYMFSHPIFRNIVTYLYANASIVFEFASCEFIVNRVRLGCRLPKDDDYVLIFDGQDNIELLANRMIKELKCNTLQGVRFICSYYAIDDDRLISCLKTRLVDSKDQDISKNIVDELFSRCVFTLWKYGIENERRDAISWPCQKLLVMLLQTTDSSNTELRRKKWYPIHFIVDTGNVLLTDLLVKHRADVNKLDESNRCVLHYAVGCENNIEMINKLLGLPNLTCIDQADSDNRTPQWYINNDKRPNILTHGCEECVIEHKEEIIKMFEEHASRDTCDDNDSDASTSSQSSTDDEGNDYSDEYDEYEDDDDDEDDDEDDG